jgi:hypothetical protein
MSSNISNNSTCIWCRTKAKKGIKFLDASNEPAFFRPKSALNGK